MNYKRQSYQRKNATHMTLSYRNDQKTIKTKLKLLVFRSQSLAVQVLVRYRQLIYKCQ